MFNGQFPPFSTIGRVYQRAVLSLWLLQVIPHIQFYSRNCPSVNRAITQVESILVRRYLPTYLLLQLSDELSFPF